MLILISLLMTISMLLVVYFMLKQGKQLTRLQEKLIELDNSQKRIAKDHPVLINADLLFAKQLREINAQLISMDNQLQCLENKRDNDGGYQHALKILEMGGDKDEIIHSCHLSMAEADLLINLNAYRSAMKTPSV